MRWLVTAAVAAAAVTEEAGEDVAEAEADVEATVVRTQHPWAVVDAGRYSSFFPGFEYTSASAFGQRF